ncbi:cytochrome c biogenesis protein CcsA [Nitratifractor sp.]|uniref:cytochrome c biogenesis protein CcsA n=1 Tax=Nitratifractor sp. TaxID=2268144 RepID=UPI0025D94E5E|nr:cytochrome c biogenesis protein CcsA [Nitratifractor sp.]
MLNKIFSMKVAVALMLIFAVAIGAATFIENDYGTQTARALVYNARWFELLLFYFCATILYNIIRFRMYRREKWGQLVLHVALLLIGIGALVTRYAGYEGIQHIREGESSRVMVSDRMILDVALKDHDKITEFERPLYLSSMTKNHISDTLTLNGKKIRLELLDYLPAARETAVPDAKKGTTVLALKAAAGGQGEDLYLAKGSEKDMGTFLLSFEGKQSTVKPTIYITQKEGNLTIESPVPLKTLNMADRQAGELPAGVHPFQPRKLYTFAGNSLVLRKVYPKARITWKSVALKPGGKYPQMLVMKVSHNGKSEVVRLKGRRAQPGTPVIVNFPDIGVKLSYGARIIPLPFAIKLDDFQLERYPGSMSPASYSSYVTVIDKERNVTMPYHIYMNHVLDYRGYRFFQSSYDMDEKGTVLSVNHDPGTPIAYLGYLLLALGFLWSYLSPKGRFQALRRKLKKLEKPATALFLAGMLWQGAAPLQAAAIDSSTITPQELKSISAIDAGHALRFGTLVVQGNGGRMKPMDTVAHEILSKIARKNEILGMNADQVLLGMLVEPQVYQKLRMIKISHPLIAKKLGLPKETRYVSYDDFFDKKTGAYLLRADVMAASRKRAADRNQYDKDLLKADERLNVAYMVFQGTLLRIFPKAGDKMHRWYAPLDAMKKFPPKEAELVRLITANYFKNVEDGIRTGQWKKADSALDVIKKYQYFYGGEIIPSQEHIKMEIAYNKFNIFNRLVPVYLLAGLLLLILAFVHILKPNFSLKWPVRITLAVLIAAFFAHTVGLGLRWYIAGHAPWSNAYESILYIAWATVLAGFVFSRRSPLTMAATSILAGIFLFVAHLNWLDPQITNLVPVLKSYWLMVHVAVITASYGFLGLGALLGMLVLVLFILRGKAGNPNIDRAIKELSIINEMTLLIGLALITVGNFLGGVWANESWGRYWSWDPKETWAAVTILVYAAVVHMRFIPKLNNLYAFNVAAVLAYSSVIMTYFGVNYYLSGMHSYAAGDPVPIPGWVWPAVASVFALILLAARNRKLK